MQRPYEPSFVPNTNYEVWFVVKSPPRSHLRLMTKALRRKLGARIRSARQSAGLSQEALANQIERTSESISNIERGGQLPAIDTLIALSGALKLPLSELLQHVDDDRDVSKERALAEARLADLVRALSDEAVSIALLQVEVLKQLR